MKSSDVFKKLTDAAKELEKEVVEETCMTVVPLVGGPNHARAYIHLGKEPIPEDCPHDKDYVLDTCAFETTAGERIVKFYLYIVPPNTITDAQMMVMDALLIFHGEEK